MIQRSGLKKTDSSYQKNSVFIMFIKPFHLLINTLNVINFSPDVIPAGAAFQLRLNDCGDDM
jgi:hypothetical protein